MKTAKMLVLMGVMIAITLNVLVAPAQAKTYKLMSAAGHPPIFLWVTLTRDFFIPEVDRRLADAGNKDKIVWDQAYGGTMAKLGGVLEAIEEGIVDSTP